MEELLGSGEIRWKTRLDGGAGDIIVAHNLADYHLGHLCSLMRLDG